MRLNRVLLLAATISTMMFALVFTISCSGDDGTNGKNGVGCTVEPDGSDWNIICDGEEVGTMHSGDGKPGQDGTPGKDGMDGENCWLSKVGVSYEVRCGSGQGQVKGILDGCTILTEEGNDYLVTLVCGKSEINMCKSEIFDPTEKICNTAGTLSTASVFAYCGPKDIKYNTSRQYCGFGEGDKEKYNAPATVYNRCGIGSVSEMPNVTEYDPDIYCRYTSTILAKSAGGDVGDFCNGQPLNKDSWKAQYCGYADKDTKVRSVLSGACDTVAVADGPQGPNEEAFGQGFCEVKFEHKLTGKTTYSENLCGTSTNNKPNNGSWKNEYCGHADSSSVAPTKVYVGLCDNSTATDLKGPHLESFNKGYCKANRHNKTEFVEDEFCGDDGKPNETTWKGEYCGYESAAASGATKVYTGICDDDKGPNENSWNPNEYCRVKIEDAKNGRTELSDDICENGDKVNENTWKGEYCGFASKTADKPSKQVGVCDDGDGPNSVAFGAGYCTVPVKNRITGITEYSDEFCGATGKINEGKWKGEYCGFANAKSEDDDKVYTGVCDDGRGANKGEYGQKGYCKAEDTTGVTSFSKDFCPTTGSGKYNEGGWKGEYCFQGDSRVGKCAAGLTAVTTERSSSNFKCALPVVFDYCNKPSGSATPVGSFENGTGKCLVAATTSGNDITEATCQAYRTSQKTGVPGKNDGQVVRQCSIPSLIVTDEADCIDAILKGTNCAPTILSAITGGAAADFTSSDEKKCVYSGEGSVKTCNISIKYAGEGSSAFAPAACTGFTGSVTTGTAKTFTAVCRYTP